MLQYSNYLNQIAALIKQDPSISVREIAAELKFADSKSVYYWLEKSNISGINEFKRRVLTEDRSHPASFSLDINGEPHYLVILSLYSWNTKQKNPVASWYHLHDSPQPQGLFAIRVDTNELNPWFAQDDVLIISDEKEPKEGSWVLMKSSNQYLIGKMINKQIVNPNTLNAVAGNYNPLGVIISQNRFFTAKSPL